MEEFPSYRRSTVTRVPDVSTNRSDLAILNFGPEMPAVRALATAFMPTAHAYFRLGSADAMGERDLRWRQLADTLRADSTPESAIATIADRVAGTLPDPSTLAVFTRLTVNSCTKH
jgi:hypothetical protein